MREDLKKELYEKYPSIFSNKDKSKTESCMYWGIETGDGWYPIISNLCWMIAQHERNKEGTKKYLSKTNPQKLAELPEYHPVKFDQVKEKFGGLRIYFSGGDEYIRGLVGMAEATSYNICEICGNKGKPNKVGWISTLCENCKK